MKGWLTSVLDDEYVGEIAEFDATVLEKFDGEDWVRFYHEPWTAKHMWEIQVSIRNEN